MQEKILTKQEQQERENEDFKRNLEISAENDSKKHNWNVIFYEAGTLFFYGFSKLKKNTRISDSDWGIYITPTKDFDDKGFFKLYDHYTTDEKLIEYLLKKGAINSHFVLIDGVYYKTPITVEKSNVNFSKQFPDI